MVGSLTTHVLDTATGVPAAGVAIELYRLDPDRRLLVRLSTNGDGRTDRPLLEGPDLQRGRYELLFRLGDYFRTMGIRLPEPPFLDEVTVRFGIATPDRHYHVPLLASPWSYSTYRGS